MQVFLRRIVKWFLSEFCSILYAHAFNYLVGL
jgi:hypothetical protein